MKINGFSPAVACSLSLMFLAPAFAADDKAAEIIRRADEIRSPNKPFRYTVAVQEYKESDSQPGNKQIFDISMRFIKPENGERADARSLIRFVYPPQDKGKVMLSDWYDLWFYTPELRRPIPVSRQQRLVGQISNGDVIVTNFDYAYDSTLLGEEACGPHLCYKLALVRKTEEVTYPKITYYVEKESYRPWKAAYYSLDDKLLKEVLYQNYQMTLGKVRPMRIIVREARHGKGHSVMEYSNVRFESLPESHFSREYIQRGAR